MPKFASFDPATPSPRKVTGWWDTDLMDYAELPAENARHQITDDVWQQLAADAGLHQWAIDDAGKVTVWVAPPPAAQPYDVPKLVLIDRLIGAGLLRTAYAALKMDATSDKLTDAELTLRERFNSARVFTNTDNSVRQFLAAIGGDVDALLATPPPGS